MLGALTLSVPRARRRHWASRGQWPKHTRRPIIDAHSHLSHVVRRLGRDAIVLCARAPCIMTSARPDPYLATSWRSADQHINRRPCLFVVLRALIAG